MVCRFDPAFYNIDCSAEINNNLSTEGRPTMEIPSIDRMGQVNLPFSEEMAFQLGESNSNAR